MSNEYTEGQRVVGTSKDNNGLGFLGTIIAITETTIIIQTAHDTLPEFIAVATNEIIAVVN